MNQAISFYFYTPKHLFRGLFFQCLPGCFQSYLESEIKPVEPGQGNACGGNQI